MVKFTVFFLFADRDLAMREQEQERERELETKIEKKSLK